MGSKMAAAILYKSAFRNGNVLEKFGRVNSNGEVRCGGGAKIGLVLTWLIHLSLSFSSGLVWYQDNQMFFIIAYVQNIG